LVESPLEKVLSNTTSFLGVSACQLQVVEPVFLSVEVPPGFSRRNSEEVLQKVYVRPREVDLLILTKTKMKWNEYSSRSAKFPEVCDMCSVRLTACDIPPPAQHRLSLRLIRPSFRPDQQNHKT